VSLVLYRYDTVLVKVNKNYNSTDTGIKFLLICKVKSLSVEAIPVIVHVKAILVVINIDRNDS
jgi:hypothetical protein